MIPEMDDAALSNLRDNARRLEASGQGKRQQQAAEILPLIDAELATRKAAKPAPAPRAKRVTKAKAAA
jgi:ABC-type transporter MlaC component